MLVLSRRREEKIVIGEDIVVTIVDIRGDTVRVRTIDDQEALDAIEPGPISIRDAAIELTSFTWT